MCTAEIVARNNTLIPSVILIASSCTCSDIKVEKIFF